MPLRIYVYQLLWYLLTTCLLVPCEDSIKKQRQTLMTEPADEGDIIKEYCD
jgi:hypothetical protein